MIQRYTISACLSANGALIYSELTTTDGPYVLYSDHIAAMEEKDREIAEVNRDYNRLVEELCETKAELAEVVILKEKLKKYRHALDGITTVISLLMKEGEIHSLSLQGWIRIAQDALKEADHDSSRLYKTVKA